MASGNRQYAKKPQPVASSTPSGYLAPGVVLEPPPGVAYTRVLSGVDRVTSTAVVGIVAAFLLVNIVCPVVRYALVALVYLVRGRPDGSFNAYNTAATAAVYPSTMAASSLALAALIPLTMLLMRFLHHRSPVWLTSVQPGMRWRFLLLAVIVAIVLENAVYWVSDGRTSFHLAPSPGWAGWLVLILIVTPLQTAGEEYLFRGYLTQVLGSFIPNRWASMLVSALLFALAHGTGQDLALFVNRFAFGALMGTLVLLTGGLEASIAAHAVNNVFSYGYAALSAGGVAAAATVTSVTWTTTAWNVLSYVLVALAAWTIGTRLNVARTTPPVQ